MKLILPKIEIAEEEGFNPEKDLFSRKEFGERLANLVEQSHGNTVIALDAQWGEGKSTFIKQLTSSMHLDTTFLALAQFAPPPIEIPAKPPIYATHPKEYKTPRQL